MKPEVTVGTVFCNGVHALELLWRSYYFHNKDVPARFWCWDNASTDGASDYAAKHAAKVFTMPPRTSHQQGADGMAKECSTPYFLLLDFDVEFTGPFTAKAIQLLKGDPDALCVSFPSGEPGRQFEVGNFGLMDGTKRINPCCALFRTDKIKLILEHFTFGTYFNFGTKRQFFDVGAMIRQVAEVAGMGVLEPAWIRQAVNHYGQIGALVAGHALHPKLHSALERRYGEIAKRSELYEEPPQTFGNP